MVKRTTNVDAPASTRAWRCATNSSYESVATPSTATMRESGDTPTRCACAPGMRLIATRFSGSMCMPSGSARLNETSVVAGDSAGAAEARSKRKRKTGAPSSSFAWRRARKPSYEVTGVSSTATILAPGGTP